MSARKPILVAGAGPVGLCTALLLARHGVPVALLEKRPTLNLASRASTFHPPTLEIFHALGLMDGVSAKAQLVDRIQYRSREDGVFAGFSMNLLQGQTEFPFRLHIEQTAVMPVVLERLRSQSDVAVHFGTAITGVRPTHDGVVVDAEGPDGPVSFEGSFLLAADGARSTVRDSLGLTFEGSMYEERVLRLVTRTELEQVIPDIAPLTYVYRGSRSVAFLKMPGCWRLVLRAPPELSDEAATSPDYYRPRAAEFLGEWIEQIPDIVPDIFAVGKKIASRYRKGRSYLMGDAAHITTTRGGMNMNCGIHDSYVIAQAAVRAWHDNDASILDLASDARHRTAVEQLIPHTDHSISGGDDWVERVRQAASDPERSRAFLRAATMMDMSPISQSRALFGSAYGVQ